MNKICCSFFLLLISFPIFCQDVKLEDTRHTAINFMNSRTAKSNSIQSIESIDVNDMVIINLIHFSSGGWVLLSNDYRTKPVLGYGLKGSLELEDIPSGLKALIFEYIDQILKVKNNKTSGIKIQDEWVKIGEQSKSILIADVFGLLKTTRGLVLWNQDKNNSGGCTPSYNQDCPLATSSDFCWPSSPSNCDCDRKPVGCGAVAMGQIMWYWQFPYSYNWDIIPTALYNNTPSEEAAELARLLHEIGVEANMNYCCNGSWATSNHVEEALINLGFLGATKKVRSDWPSSQAWQDLIRAELDVGRPVLYRGGAVIDPGDWGNVHYFVCDGYDRNSPSYFHFNWGWGSTILSDPDYGYCFTLDNLAPDPEHVYTSNQQMIIGISPDCTTLQESILSLPYTSIDSEVSLIANTISIPSEGSILEIGPGGNLLMSATNSITLNKGFFAKEGSSVTASVGPYDCDCDISVLGWTTYFACDGMLCYRAKNANTFEFEAFNLSGQLVFQNAGAAVDNYERTYVWDGTGSVPGWYECQITFRNNCAKELYNAYQVYSSGDSYMMVFPNETEQNVIDNKGEYENNATKLKVEPIKNDGIILIVPNPNEGRFYLKTIFDNFNVQIFNSNGNLIYNQSSHSQTIDFDLTRYANGTYIIKIITESNVFTRIIIKQ